MKKRWNLICDWLDCFAGDRETVALDSISIFAESLRFHGSLHDFPYPNPGKMREFLKHVDEYQQAGELGERWLVSSCMVSQHRLHPSVLRIFTFRRP